MSGQNALARALLLNAALSLVTGIALLAATRAIDEALGLGSPTTLMVFGATLILHAGALVLASKSSGIVWWTWLNLAIIVPYPLALHALMLAGVFAGPNASTVLIVDGLAVGLMALLQYLAVRRVSFTSD